MVTFSKSALILASVLILALFAAAIETGTITGAASTINASGLSCSATKLYVGIPYPLKDKVIRMNKINNINSRASGIDITVNGKTQTISGSGTINDVTITVISTDSNSKSKSAKLILCVKPTCTNVKLAAGKTTTHEGKTISAITIGELIPVVIDISGKTFTYTGLGQKESNNGAIVTLKAVSKEDSTGLSGTGTKLASLEICA